MTLASCSGGRDILGASGDLLDPLPPAAFPYGSLVAFVDSMVTIEVPSGYYAARDVAWYSHPGFYCHAEELQAMKLLIWRFYRYEEMTRYRAYVWARGSMSTGRQLWYLMELNGDAAGRWNEMGERFHETTIRQSVVCFGYAPTSREAYMNLFRWNQFGVKGDDKSFFHPLSGVTNHGFTEVVGAVRVNTWESIFGEEPNVVYVNPR